jgi:glucosamine kinase
MAYFLAVDAGGTKAEFLLAEEDRELARVICGTVKRLNATEDEAAHHLDDALGRLSAQTGIAMNQIARTCIGTSGNTVPLVTDWLRENFAARVSGSLLIAGDVEIALEAAFPSGPAFSFCPEQARMSQAEVLTAKLLPLVDGVRCSPTRAQVIGSG